MSVYSGFATRLQETQYNGFVCKLLSLLERRIVAALRSDPFDSDQWIMSFAGVYKAMRKMETQKYQQPKFSAYCKELAQAYGAYSRAMTHDESSTSSYVSSTGKEWELYMRQVESMLIEESKIPRISAHTPDEPLLKPVLRTAATRGSESAASPVAYQRSSRSRQLSIKTPRNQPESVDSGLYPRSMGFARIDELSEGSARKRRKKKNKLAEVYQDRGYTRLLSELRT